MSKEIVLDRLNNLKYLRPLKNANITAMSKKNTYGDVVKFYAQINTEEVVQKISYKATGCSHFIAYCDYYCQLVEGKNLKKIQKITIEDLEKFDKLDKTRVHVADIILTTFVTLIKKYKKGVDKGTITPCEVEENIEDKEIKSKNVKKIDKKENLEISLTKKYSKVKEKKVVKKTKVKEVEVVSQAIDEQQITTKDKKLTKNVKKSDKQAKENSQTIKTIETQNNTIGNNEQEANVTKKSSSSLDMLLDDLFEIRNSEIKKDELSKTAISTDSEVKSNKSKSKANKKKVENESTHKDSIDIIVPDVNDKKQLSKASQSNHANKLTSLSSKITKTKKESIDVNNNDSVDISAKNNKVSNLSMMINNIHSKCSSLFSSRLSNAFNSMSLLSLDRVSVNTIGGFP